MAGRGMRALSSSSGSQSSGSGGGGLAALSLVAGAFFSAGYYSEHNPNSDSFNKTVASVPGLDGVVGGGRQLVQLVGLGAEKSKSTSAGSLEPPSEAVFKAVDVEVKKGQEKAKKVQSDASDKTKAAEQKAKADAEKVAAAAAAAKKAEEAKKAAKAEAVLAKEAEKAAALEKAKADALAAAAAKAEAEAKAAAKAVDESVPAKEAVTPAQSSAEYARLPMVAAERATQTSAAAAPIVESVQNDLTRQSLELRRELESTLLSDLHELDEHALRTRVTQLAAEFFERTKWEGVRVHQTIKQVEGDLSRRYDELLKEQRMELELEANKMLLAREQQAIAKAFTEAQDQVTTHEKHYAASLRKAEAGFQKEIGAALADQAITLTDDLQDKLNHEVATMRQQHVQTQLETQAKISELEASLAAFHEATLKISKLNESAANAHRFTAAVLNLQKSLQTSQPVLNQVKAVKKYADSDPLVEAVVSSLPGDLLESGAPDVDELKLRFNVLRDELRKVAMAPKDLPPSIAQGIGSLLASFYWVPSGPIQGDGNEEILSRANYTLGLNDLPSTLKELESIQDPVSQSLMVDWVRKAKNRMVAEQAVNALQSQAILKHSVMGGAK